MRWAAMGAVAMVVCGFGIVSTFHKQFHQPVSVLPPISSQEGSSSQYSQEGSSSQPHKDDSFGHIQAAPPTLGQRSRKKPGKGPVSSKQPIEQSRIENLPVITRNFIDPRLANKLANNSAPSVGAAPTSESSNAIGIRDYNHSLVSDLDISHMKLPSWHRSATDDIRMKEIFRLGTVQAP